MQDVSLLSAQEVTSQFAVDPGTGLSTTEAQARLTRYGNIELVGKEPEPAWKRFVRQLKDPLIYLLFGAIVISLLAWGLEGASGLPIDALVIAVIIIANAVIGFVEENKAEDAVAALATMAAARATVFRDGKLQEISASQIVPGDILSLSEGTAVGADGRLLSATALHIQEASLTGESMAVQKNPQTLEEETGIGDRLNMVYKGTAVTSGVGRAVVTATGMDTEVGRIATLLDETESAPTPLEKEIARISKTLGLLVIVIALAVMAALWIINGVSSLHEAVDILLLGVSLAVAAVPEGLPAILSLVLAIGVQAMARRKAIMKDLHSVETLGSTSVICSDKTGTLTRNEMTIRKIVTASGTVELTGTGYEPVGEAKITQGDPLPTQQEAKQAIIGGMAANNAQLTENELGDWEILGDPTEAAFLVAGPKLGLNREIGSAAVERIAEVPFNSARKLMSVLVKIDESLHVPGAIQKPDEEPTRTPGPRYVLYAKGAPDVLLTHCTAEYVGGETQSRPLTPAASKKILTRVEALSARGYRTLGVALRPAQEAEAEDFGEVSETELTYIGTVAIIDPPRPEAKEAIRQAHGAGIRTVMITGDHPVTAQTIAEELGMSMLREEAEKVPAVLTGQQISRMSQEELDREVLRTDVYARVAPEHKLQIVESLQKQGQIVAMTGDGVNDAPALKTADIGIAMGITGTEVTKEAAKMILADDNYATIVAAVRQGRNIFDNIRKFMRYLLSSNMGEVFTVFLGVVCGGLIGLHDPQNPAATVVPLLATQILWINLVTDSGPALAMGVDPEVDDVMKRKPRPLGAPVIDRTMWEQIILIGLVMGLTSLAVYDLCLPGGFIGGLEHLAAPGEEFAAARTTVFTALVFMQLTNALNSRSATITAFKHMFSNHWLWGAIVLAIVLQIAVVEWAPLQSAFGTVSLAPQHWGLAIGAGLVVLAVEELCKFGRRAYARRQAK
ncbi:cation-translocating P-type ATPase [Actinobaculum suis]|uniref:cation-translocating P-type ATPase n=1 Tax=Actinobaculum suis TaxID=1657 RepID=UPI0009F1CB6B|nr:cation-translocating P-type ATPase [Actinobaculum suis]